MKIQKPKRRKKIIITLSIVLAIAGGLFAWCYIEQKDHDNSNSREDATKIEGEESKTSEDKTEDNPKNTEAEQQTDTSANEAGDPIKPDADSKTKTNKSDVSTDDIPINKATKLTITRLEQVGDKIYLDSKLSNKNVSGKCTATFVSEFDRPIVKEFNSNGKEGCGPLVINALEFAALGEWKVTLRLFSTGNDQLVTNGKVNIQ